MQGFPSLLTPAQGHSHNPPPCGARGGARLLWDCACQEGSFLLLHTSLHVPKLIDGVPGVDCRPRCGLSPWDGVPGVDCPPWDGVPGVDGPRGTLPSYPGRLPVPFRTTLLPGTGAGSF